MENYHQIISELKLISPMLADAHRKNAYSIPEGYFDQLPKAILDRILAENSEFSLPKAQPFTVPEGFFNQFSDLVMNRIKQQESEVYQELEAIAPLLNTISKENIYTVPEGYFTKSLVPDLSLLQQEKSKVIPMLKPVHSFRKYAIAAALTGIMAIGGWLLLNNNSSDNLAVTPAAANDRVSQQKDEVLTKALASTTYKEAKQLNVKEAINKIHQADLDGYLQTIPKTFSGSFAVNDESINVENSLEVINTEEISNYMDDLPVLTKNSF